MDWGTRVGELPQDYVPGGVLIDLLYNAYPERFARTNELLHGDAPAVYEASFSADGVYGTKTSSARASVGSTMIVEFQGWLLSHAIERTF